MVYGSHWFLILSCVKIEEDVNIQSKTPELETEIIDFKGLTVKHRFRTPAKDLTIELSEPGVKKMFTAIKKENGTL